MKPVNVGIIGLGTVGGGTFNVLTRNAEEIARRAGRPINVTQVGARRDNPNCDTRNTNVTRNVLDVVENADIDIVVELIGGTTLARDIILRAIENGKHVVTANKALLALHGNEIFARAAEKGVNVAFESAVAGGIPIIKAIREGLAGNRIQWVAGIINGTSNFILTEMWEKGRAFNDVLKEAQALGYAESDPTFDVEGIDAAHKLTILASIAYGIPLQFEKAYTQGISQISQVDVKYAEQLGYRIKTLGITRRTSRGIELRVHPTLIKAEKILANVNGVMNAVMVKGDAVGQTLYYGPGAGAEPTASSVVADIVDVARALTTDPLNRVPHLAFRLDRLADDLILPIEDIETGYYLRLQAEDSPGVLALITKILSDKRINIEAIVQKEAEEGENTVPIIMLTKPLRERDMNEAIQAMQGLPEIVSQIVRIRVEELK